MVGFLIFGKDEQFATKNKPADFVFDLFYRNSYQVNVYGNPDAIDCILEDGIP